MRKHPHNYEIIVGLHKLSEEDAKTVQHRKIAKIVVHKDYDKKTFNNDIALLRTTMPLNIVGSKGCVNGICLPRSNSDPTGYAKVIGWGLTKEGGKQSDILKEVVIPLVPRSCCLLAYDKNRFDEFDIISKNMICAGVAGKDSCQSDSGGPLFQTNMGVSTLIGIVSFGIGCGRKCCPGVYTKVSMYRDWMEKIILK